MNQIITKIIKYARSYGDPLNQISTIKLMDTVQELGRVEIRDGFTLEDDDPVLVAALRLMLENAEPTVPCIATISGAVNAFVILGDYKTEEEELARYAPRWKQFPKNKPQDEYGYCMVCCEPWNYIHKAIYNFDDGLFLLYDPAIGDQMVLNVTHFMEIPLVPWLQKEALNERS